MKKKSYVLSFFVGFGVFLILCLPAMFVATIWLDMNKVNSFSLGHGWYTIYSFTKEGNGFSFQTGMGIFIVCIAGGALSVSLKYLTRNLVKFK